ncbi:MAG: phage antirepressor KilAC domain-containing protein [Methanothrix sp.]|nr:phage antirepressor KilAC domain-containing protein [Methanothrix sp.]
MDDLELFPVLPSRKTMTVREVAEALGCDDETVRRHVKSLWPDVFQNGKTTYLDELMVLIVKQKLGTSGRNDLRSVAEARETTTALEIEEMTLKVISYHKGEAARLRAELAAAAPKIELADAIGRSDRQMSITDCAKHFSLHPKTEVFPYLRAHGYLTEKSLPTQAALNAGYLSLKETKDQAGNVWPQAVVEAWQLDNWRAHVVHQIKRWVHEENRP